ncbi:Fur family transcriptional regulator [Halonatronum saccharophilum]|uniref:Fur family transcriptional regulator n=1 Tax=Halonatronum saccharophilum TaxID=150060 RepID=UPI00048A25AE|nr:transcriptional repressor [Halonatronum saccharophilum]
MKKTTRRMTKQRKKILEVLKATKSHPTADWIYDQVKKEIPNISLGTIYRNLNVLREMGEIIELSYGSSYSRFDANTENHYHFTCLECGLVQDVDFEVDLDMDKKVNMAIEGDVKYHRCEFFGYCKECK